MDTPTLLTEVTVEDLFHREHEVLERIVCFEPWQRCYCNKQIATAMAHWSDDAPFTVTTGQINHTQRFTVVRHADGTPPRLDESWTAHSGKTTYHSCMNKISKCTACGELETLSTKQEAWGDRVTCSACGDSKYYSIGD